MATVNPVAPKKLPINSKIAVKIPSNNTVLI